MLGIVRKNGAEKLKALFNFSEFDKKVWLDEESGTYTDLISGNKIQGQQVDLPAYGAYWLLSE